MATIDMQRILDNLSREFANESARLRSDLAIRNAEVEALAAENQQQAARIAELEAQIPKEGPASADEPMPEPEPEVLSPDEYRAAKRRSK